MFRLKGVLWILLLVVMLGGCGSGSDSESTAGSSGGDVASCGDRIVNGSELCDGSSLAGSTCETLDLGYQGGVLRCNPTCDGWDTSGCLTDFPVQVLNQCAAVAEGYCNAQDGGTCYYIDALSGNDSNPGTFARPWQTAINISTLLPEDTPLSWVGLSSGDVVYFMEGVHSEVVQGLDQNAPPAVVTLQGVNGTVAAPITIRNYPGRHAVLDPDGEGRGIYLYFSSHINVEGLEIRNSNDRGLAIEGGNSIIADNLLVYNTDGWVGANVAGVEIVRSTDVELRNSILFDNYDRESAANNDQTENSCNMVLFRNAGTIGVYDNVFFQTQPNTGHYSGCGVKFKHSSVDQDCTFDMQRNYLENHRFAAIGVSTHHATIAHNIINGVGNPDSWGVGRALDSRDWGGLTHQLNQVFEYNTIYADRAFLMIPTNQDTNGENGPWNDLTGNVFRYNVFYQTNNNGGGDPPIELYSAMSDALYTILTTGISFDYNCYYNPSGPVEFGFAEADNFGVLGGRFNLAQWQNDYGWDQHSYEIDPGFVEADNLDFTPTALQCADRGALAGNTTVSTAKAFRILCDN